MMFAATVAAQQPSAAGVSTVSVFLDCQGVSCDLDFVQTEIAAVRWVRDRTVSDVHVLVTGQDNGAGGREFTLTFIGLKSFAGLADTLKFSLPPSFTEDDRRQGLVKQLRIGLVRYVARTPQVAKMTISLGAAADTAAKGAVKDKWRSWVFETSFGTFAQAEERYQSYDRWGNVSANRVTKAWKTQLSYYRSRYRSENQIDDTTTYINGQSSFGVSVLQAKSLGEHWSAGLRADLNGSTYDNFKRATRVTPAIEYNVFPYSASTRRQLRFEYNAGYSEYAYNDSTINDKLAESRLIHRLQVAFSLREPWGSGNIGVSGVHYLGDSTQYRAGVFGGVSLKIVKGLNVNFDGNYQSIHDQFYLAKKDFSASEILLRQFQFGTKYRFWGSVNISYTFGSIFNTVVNPRFSGAFN